MCTAYLEAVSKAYRMLQQKSRAVCHFPVRQMNYFPLQRIRACIFRLYLEIRSTSLSDIARRIEKIRCRVTSEEETFVMNILCGLLHKPELSVDELIHMEKDADIRQKMLDELRNETIVARNISNGSTKYYGQATKVCVEEYYKEKKCFHCKSIEDMKF